MNTYSALALVITALTAGLIGVMLHMLWQLRTQRAAPAATANPQPPVSLRHVQAEAMITAIMDIDYAPHPNPYPKGSEAWHVWEGYYAMSAHKAREVVL
jgi:hypothetical protein